MRRVHASAASILLAALLLLSAARAFAQSLYWETPQVFVPRGVGSSSSAVGGSLLALAWQEIKPHSATDRTNGDIYLSLAVSRDGISWKQHPQFYGPIHYTGVSEGNEPRVYSMTVDSSDRILVAIAASDRETAILQSVDQGATFKEVQRLDAPASTGAPYLFRTSGGGFLLMVSQGTSNTEVTKGTGSVTFEYSTSRNGSDWRRFAPFITASEKLGSSQLQATHASLQGREYVVFQSLTARSESTTTWQLYMKSSPDGGASWDPAVPITTRTGVFGDDPLSFNNERPRLAALEGRLALVWERSPFGSDTPRIWTARLDGKGAFIGAPEILAPDGPARFARVIYLKGQEYVLYADGSKGAFRIMLAQKGRTWEAQPLQNTDVVNALFPHAIVLDNSLYVFWENQATASGTSSLVALRPLASVGSPVVKALDFVPGQPANKETITVAWSEPQPPDPSGIKEYQYTWTLDDGVTTVEKEKRIVSGLVSDTRLFSTRKVDRDGTWTFSITALDLAGNVSRSPATISFVRDATPPKPVGFEVLDADGRPLLTAPPGDPEKRDLNAYAVGTNTFTLRWVPGGDTDIVGYTYNTQPGWSTLADYRESKVPLLAPPPRVVTTGTEIAFRNGDNGVYAVTVRAIDRAGNIGASSTIALALSNYVPLTRVDFVSAERDPLLGTVRLTIVGRGFTENGTVRKIYLDRAHKAPPWDLEFDPTQPVTVTDRMISGIVLDSNRESGAYRIGLLQERASGPALYFTPNAMFTFVSPGTVKIGNFQLLLPRWVAGRTPEYALSFDSLLIFLVVILLGALSFLSIRKIVALAQEGAILRGEVTALLSGRPNMGWEERKKRMQTLKKRGVGLRMKFTLLMVILVAMIVLIVSVPLGFQMVSRQRLALVTGLTNNANILMDALASSAETQYRLGTDGFVEAVNIPRLRTAMTEADYTTITGPDPSLTPVPYPKDFVWASDESGFAAQRTRGTFQIAKQVVRDGLAPAIPSLQKQIDGDALKKFATVIDEYRTLQGQANELRTKTDASSKTRLAAVIVQEGQKSAELDTLAKAEYAHFSTLEPFNSTGRLRPTYLFYKPIIYYNRAPIFADTSFYQGMVRLEVKTDAITRQINESIGAILKIAGSIALAAIALGVLGAIIMASITVTPIRKLAQGVAKIRDTEKKETLKDHTIVVNTHDEIGELADTVNAMTQGLVKAAIANNELLAGIDVQKRFLPLVKGVGTAKGSTAEEENDKVEVYGYYRGAKGVSGDYFDFKKLDDTHYALIKCDVAGKGVSAALIMVEVATIFISYFRDWVKRKESIAQIKDPKAKLRAVQELDRIDSLVYTINDMVEERGFPGRFAAFTVCILNSATGLTTVCNAGDTIINVYEVEQKKMVHNQLPDSPAAGTFPSMLVEMKAPYKQVVQRLDRGDVLFLQTDGIEESKRKLRNSAFEEIVCDEPGLAPGEFHLGTHKKGDKEGTEEFGTTRIDGVLNAMFNGGTYRLVRNHNPIADEELTFDFSSCSGTAREAVLALIAVEKVYRLIPDPHAGEGSRVLVDTNVDAFLQKHFAQYKKYFAHPLAAQQDPGYVAFSHAREDDQYDDLTILVVRRK
jgi:hypothetical protein